jgi:PIN domain nuclease of toxin-antitoxin system
MNDVLLDTCALLWWASGAKIAVEARSAIANRNVYVSPISAWEIANLVRKHRIALTLPTTTWFRQATEKMQAAMPQLTVEILTGSCELPGSPPNDPADRIIIATAREANMVVITRDNEILTYSQTGYVRTLAC